VAGRLPSLEALAMNRDFWANRQVLITGHTGFKGSWLNLILKRLGANLNGISLQPDPSSLFCSLGLEDQFTSSYYLDIRDEVGLSELIKKISPEIVFHLAAQPIVLNGYMNPTDTYSTNITGTINILESLRNLDTKPDAIVVVTSDKCYEATSESSNFVESDKLGGSDPYSASKACVELITKAYYDSYFRELGIGVATARAGNVIGGGDFSSNRLIPDIIRAHASKSELRLRNPEATRPWQHVIDPLAGYILLAEKLKIDAEKYSSAWNFGPDYNVRFSVSEMVKKFNHVFPVTVITEVSKFMETDFLSIDSTKSRKLLGWTPRFETLESIELTVEWYQAHVEKRDMLALINLQIDRYFAGIDTP
jgi:CDP-glucose 4,6-dehydratase